MSARATSWALRQKVGSRALKNTLVDLAECADPVGQIALGQTALSARLGLSERQIRQHLSGLEAIGAISRRHRNKGNRGRTTDVIALSLDRTFDVSKCDLALAGYDVRKGKFSSGSGRGSSPEGLLPVALPEGNFRANREYISTGSAEPKTQQSIQGEKPADRRAKIGDAAASVEGSPPASKHAPHGTTSARRWSGSYYARQRAALDRLTRGTVH